MADSIRQRILQNVVTTLTGITTANGYRNTLPATNIHRASQGVPRVLNFPSVFLAYRDEVLQIDSRDYVTRLLTVDLTAVGQQTTVVLEESIEGLVADMQQAMAQDHTRGGLAITQTEPAMEEPEFSAVFVDHAMLGVSYGITYRHLRTNPATP